MNTKIEIIGDFIDFISSNDTVTSLKIDDIIGIDSEVVTQDCGHKIGCNNDYYRLGIRHGTIDYVSCDVSDKVYRNETSLYSDVLNSLYHTDLNIEILVKTTFLTSAKQAWSIREMYNVKIHYDSLSEFVSDLKLESSRLVNEQHKHVMNIIRKKTTKFESVK